MIKVTTATSHGATERAAPTGSPLARIRRRMKAKVRNPSSPPVSGETTQLKTI